MKNQYILLSTSPSTHPTRKPHIFANLNQQRRFLYRKPHHNNTGKEIDPETGLYYFGARYLDPKASRWLSGDPAVSEYIPSAPVNEEARKRNGNLPGMGGVFNYVNLHVYHYGGNNPVKYVDPDGNDIITSDTTREQYNEMTSGEFDYFAERIWNEAQDFLIENPNGAYYRAPGELHWQRFENKNDIEFIDPNRPNIDLLAAAFNGGIIGIGEALVRPIVVGELWQIFNNRRFFMHWIRGNRSLSRQTNPLNLEEAQELIDIANKFGIYIDNNLNGLLGNETKGAWAHIPHFKIGDVHIPIQRGIHNDLRFQSIR